MTYTPYKTPLLMLMMMQAAMQFSFAAWWVLIKNFAIDEISLTGFEIGLQETIREIPGFLAFLAIYLILFMRERSLALLSLVFLGGGVLLTGYFNTLSGLLVTTFIMSVGFHYYETCNQSLSLQWLSKSDAPKQMGKIIAAGAFAQLTAYGLIFGLWKSLDIGFASIFTLSGIITLSLILFIYFWFPSFETGVPQKRKLIIKKRYWLFYALTFMGGARRQIFTVFAALLMVEKFDYDVHHVASLFIINGIINMLLAPQIGRLIGKIGERNALILEYIGLIGVFISYAFVQSAEWAATLYVIDHAFFAMAIAIKTYFQKIADPSDIAPTAGVAFTINHIAAVFVPVLFGIIWIYSPHVVFLSGAFMALCSLLLALMVPRTPQEGHEVRSILPSPTTKYRHS